MSHTQTSAGPRSLVILTLLVLLSVTSAVEGGSLTLAWDRSPDSSVDGYIVEWGVRSGSYTQKADVGNSTRFTIDDLSEGRTYYVIVRSRTAAGERSAPSNEAVGLVAGSSDGGTTSGGGSSGGGTTSGGGSGSLPEPGADAGTSTNAELPPAPAAEPEPRSPARPVRPDRDFDADSRDDLPVHRPLRREWHVRGSSGLELYVSEAENSGAGMVSFSADFDGDGVADIGSWAPSPGRWVLYASGNDYQWASAGHLGSANSIPVPADYDGDGAADIAVFEPSGLWTIQGQQPQHFGGHGDIPVPSDYDGDGIADLAVFRPLSGTWHFSGLDLLDVSFGDLGDIPLPADYDGDGQTDLAVYRPSNSTWYVKGQFKVTFGQQGDTPIPMDTDGDGRAEVVVHRSTDGRWFRVDPETGVSDQFSFGEAGDVPLGPAPFFQLLGFGVSGVTMSDGS